MKKLAFILCVLMTLLSACQSKPQGESLNETLRIGVMPSVDHLPLLVAADKHYFDSLGLEVEFVNFASPMERDAALQAGELDATISDYTTVMLQNQKGLPVQLLFATDGLFSFMASPKAEVNTVSGLRGKRIGLSSNTVIEYATDKLLEASGITPQDIEKVEVQKIPLRMEMLAQGELDGAILPEPFVRIGQSRGLIDLSRGLQIGETTLRITGLAVYHKKGVDKSKALARLVQAYNKAINYLNSEPIETWAKTVAPKLRIEEALFTGLSFKTFSHASSPTTEDMASVASWLKAKALIPQDYEPNNVVMPLPSEE